MSRTLLLAGLLLPACASDQNFYGSDDIGGGGGSQIRVDPPSIEFGDAGSEDTVVQEFTVTNVGEADLEVFNMEIMGEDLGSFTIVTPIEDQSFLLPPSAEQVIEVAFRPVGADDLVAHAVVRSDDEDDSAVTVDLFGNGLVPDLEIDPNPYDFGDTWIGCPRTADFSLVNVGRDVLTVESVTLTGDTDAFAMVSFPTLPLVLRPDEETTVTLEFDPPSDLEYDATLVVGSDTPAGEDRGESGGLGMYAGEFTDTWEIPVDPPVDLMFVVDQSGSMDDDQRSLAENFQYFITQLGAYTTDWHIVVVNAYSGCNNSGLLTSSTPNYVSTFQAAVQDGSQAEWETRGESGLYVSHQAVEKTDAGECNASFMRSDALLHIIVVTDEVDQTTTSGGWAADVAAIQAKKGSVADTRISAVAGDYPSGCGSAEPARGLYEAVVATGGVFLSICGDWSHSVEDLADASVQLTVYELSHTPDPDTIHVEVEGHEVRNGWTWDAAGNAVVFTSNIPGEGETVEITYSALEECD